MMATFDSTKTALRKRLEQIVFRNSNFEIRISQHDVEEKAR